MSNVSFIFVPLVI